jgi:tetratricopeptide (TPR) repeat protein
MRALVLALLVAAGAAQAVDTSYSSSGPADALTGARTLIAQKNWGAAVDELKRLNAADDADWNNLMGFALRKSPQADLAAAERFYDAALRIAPQHRGALAYSGELYLMLGDLPRAEQRLAALDKACFLPCGEYSDLKKTVARFKANGNRFVAE